MSNVEKYFDQMIDIVNDVKQIQSKFRNLGNGSPEWALERIAESYKSMFKRFCPFKVDDRVQLKENVNPLPESGWYSCRHFLVKGATATVVERSYRHNKFAFYIIFDRETYITSNGLEKPNQHKHQFHFTEDKLEHIK